MSEVAALVLPDSAVSSSAPVNFQGFPGTFTPGKPVSVDELANAAGMSPRELTDLAHDLGLPLKKTKAAEKDAALDWGDNHMPPGDPAKVVPPEKPADEVANADQPHMAEVNA